MQNTHLKENPVGDNILHSHFFWIVQIQVL